jgi:pentatricopeptide repeat protein
LSGSHLHFSAWAKSEAPNAVEHALSILGAMEEKGLQPNVQTYNSVIDCIARRGENPQQAEAILDRMTKAGVHPNIVAYNAVINGTFNRHFYHACSSLPLFVCWVHLYVFQPGRSLRHPML